MHPPNHPTLLTEDDLIRELVTARGEVDRLLASVRDFVTFAHDHPWRYLDDVMGELRAASTTVAVLEQILGRTT